MATSIVLDGITFTDTDFAGLGYTDSVIVDGTAYPRFQALFVAALNQIESDTVGVSGQAIAIRWTFQDPTTDSDPGSGNFQLDNASFSSVTEIYVDDVDASGNTVEPIVATWDDSTSSVKGVLGIIDPSAPTRFAYYQVTGITNNSGYKTIAVTHIASNGSLTDGTSYTISFGRTGDKGDTGNIANVSAQPTGTSLADDDFLLFADTDDSGATKKITVLNAKDAFVSAGGATELTTGSAVTLTVDSTFLQSITPTTDIVLNMPDATTLAEGGPLYRIENKDDTNSIAVRNAGGRLLDLLAAQEIGTFDLADNSTAAGTWSRFAATRPSGILITYSDVFEAASLGTTEQSLSIVKIGDKKGIIVYRDGGNSDHGTAIAVDYSSGPDFGSPVVFNAAATGSIDAARIADDQAIVCFSNNGTSGDAVVLTVSGTAITVNTADGDTFESASVSFISVCVNSSTLATVSYRDGGNSDRITACPIAIANTTELTAGTPLQVSTNATNGTSIDAVTATTSLLAYSNSTGTNARTLILTESSGTLSAASDDQFDSDDPGVNLDVVVLSSTRGLVFFEDDGTVNDPAVVVPITISGTSVSAGSAVTVQTPSGAGTSSQKIVAIDADTAFAAHSDDNANVVYTQKIAWNSGTPLASNQNNFAIDVGFISLAELSSGAYGIAYRDVNNSSYGTIAYIEEIA